MIRHADESESWVGDVPQVLVEVVSLLAIRYKDIVICVLWIDSVGVLLTEEG